MDSVKLDDYSDLIELGIDINEGDVLSSKFNKCVKHIQGIAGTLDNSILLKFYSFYKQSNEGKCNIAKPSWYDMKSKAKWEAWNSLGDMSTEEAKNKYITYVLEVCPNFDFDEAQSKSESWARVSSLAQNEPTTLDKNICDYIRSGDINKVKEYLLSNNKNKHFLDGNGIGLLHYASDIGNLKILQLLINGGLDVNCQDSEGQTALHYAASCGHDECIKYLLSNGARLDIVDSDGCSAADVACDDVIKALLI